MVFYRPNIEDFVFPDLPNSTRCQDITNSTPNNAYPAKYLDIDIIGAYQMGNNLQLQIDGVAAGILPGSSDPLNNNKAVIKDPNGTISYVFISDQNVLPGGFSTQSFAQHSVDENILGLGAVTTSNLRDLCATDSKIASMNGAKLVNNTVSDSKIINVDGSKVNDESITSEKIFDLNGNKIVDRTLSNEKLILNSITIQEIALSLYNLFVPIGTTIIFCGTTGIPENWLECNGQAISRTTYATLFANIGTEWGTGDGATTFNLPDFRGRTLVGIGSNNSTNGLITNATAPNITLGATGIFGAQTVTLDITQIPPHNHSIPTSGGSYIVNTGVSNAAAAFSPGSTGNAGGGLPHNNTQPSAFVRFYIRAL